MTKKRTSQEIVRGKTNISYGGGIDYKPPSAGQYLFKNSDEDDDINDDDIIKEELLRSLISEIIRKCGDKWCLYTKAKDKKTGKRRRLGTHSSKKDAVNQEIAIKANSG